MARRFAGSPRLVALSIVSHFAIAAAAIAATLLLIDLKPWRHSTAAQPAPVALCDGSLSFLGLVSDDAGRAIFGERIGDYPAVRSVQSGESSGLLAVSFGKPVADSFDLVDFNSRQDASVPRFARVHFDSMPSDLGAALRDAVKDSSGNQIYRPAVYFHATQDEGPLSWSRVDAVFEPVLDRVRSQGGTWERFASAPSCYIARQRRDDEVLAVYAMSTSAGSEREQAQCYWTALQTAYGLSGVSYLYHRQPLQDAGDRYAAAFFPQNILHRRRPADWGIGAGSYVLNGPILACPDILALTDKAEG